MNRKLWLQQVYRGGLLQKYYVETKVFYTTANIGSECNEITFINSGTTAPGYC